jgi:arylsulfatase A-like enzyme
MRALKYWLVAVSLLTSLGCESMTIVVNSLLEHPLPSRYGNTVGREDGFKHVVIIAIDGLRADSFYDFVETSHESYFRTLLGVTQQKDGTFTYRNAVRAQNAVTVFPSYSFPSWTSLVTGVYPGLHGITGNQLLFRKEAGQPPGEQSTPKARYYTEENIDALAVYWAHLLNDDIPIQSPTIYDVVAAAKGQSLIVHHMISRGAKDTDWRYPSYETAVKYMKNDAEAYDHSTLYEFASAFKALNANSFPNSDAEVYLPVITTLYFPGLDHDSHIHAGRPHERQLVYLKNVDAMLKNLFHGSVALEKVDGGGQVLDRLDWPGLNRYPKLLNETLFVLVSDHGHSPIAIGRAISSEELEEALGKVPAPWRSGTLHAHTTSFNFFQLLSSAIFYVGDPGQSDDAFVMLNGGSAAVYLRQPKRTWADEPHPDHIRRVAEAVWGWFAVNKAGTLQAIFVRHGSSYLECCQQGAAIPIEESSSDYGPEWKQRLRGLAPVNPTRANSSPDLILLANRKAGYTFANHQLPWTGPRSLADLNTLWKADHGHLSADDSAIPLLFFSPKISQSPRQKFTIPRMSIVDVAPTILDALGLGDLQLAGAGLSYKEILARYPAHRGQSYYETIQKTIADKTKRGPAP